jgi:alpha-ketoglutarate-dependent sulfate ester dioxygenase
MQLSPGPFSRRKKVSQSAVQPLAEAPLDIHPITGRIGAEIAGVSLSGDLPPATVAAIRAALVRHKVVFFRGQTHLDEAGQERFGRLLGKPINHPTVPSLTGTEHILELDGAKGQRAASWHTDITFIPAYPQFSILRGVVVPAVGGDTVWANTATAYDDLPAPLKTLADQLWAVHSNLYDYAGTRPTASGEAVKHYREVFTSTVYETEHPLVRIHPESGEKALILGHFLQRILGLSSSDSAHLFSVFQDHVIRPENTVRWRWAVGDVAIWDNRATQHRAVDDYGDQPRIVRRVTIEGDVPVSVDGRRSVARKGPSTVPAAA